MDESNPTCNKRFAKLGIPQNEEARRVWRELLITTPDLNQCISGVILYDETMRQQQQDGTFLVEAITNAGMIPGIKVDTGAKEMAGYPGEKITEGLDGLRDRLAEYVQMGARFAKWRAVIAVDVCLPSRGCIEANAHALARYAALCQERADKNIDELLENLHSTFHQLRQTGIDEELFDVISGYEALSKIKTHRSAK
jgi:fructose-bisphosphate aldolase class I